MKILVFLHGTTIMHSSGKDKHPSERGNQVLDRSDKTIFDFENYISIDNSNEILKAWSKKGIEIIYMSSHRNRIDAEKDIEVLKKYDFPSGEVLYRNKFGGYKNLVKKVMPDIIIEDNCECIGKFVKEKFKFMPNVLVNKIKTNEMIYQNLPAYLKKNIRSIVIDEFEGIKNIKI
jgi:hypothetical protein